MSLGGKGRSQGCRTADNDGNVAQVLDCTKRLRSTPKSLINHRPRRCSVVSGLRRAGQPPRRAVIVFEQRFIGSGKIR
jgi:hypothetical protein